MDNFQNNMKIFTLNPNIQSIEAHNLLDMIKEEFQKCEINEDQQQKLSGVFHIIKGFCVLREPDKEPANVKKSILGVVVSFFTEENKEKQVRVKLIRTALDELNIFNKKPNEGLDIFYILLAGIAQKHEIFKQILSKNDLFDILLLISKHYYQKAEAFYQEDLEDWNQFYENIQKYFEPQEVEELFALLLFLLIQYLVDQQRIFENQPTTQKNKNVNVEQEPEVENENDSTGLSQQLQDIDLQQLQNLLQTKWNNDYEGISVKSFKLGKKPQKRVSVYLYTQLVNMIFQRIELNFKIQNQSLYQKILVQPKLFFLTCQNSSGGGLAELLRDELCNIILEQQSDFQGPFIISKMRQENKTLCDINKIKEVFQKDTALNFIEVNERQYKVKTFEEEYRIGLSIEIQDEMRANSKNQILKQFSNQDIESAIDLAFKLQEEIKKIQYYVCKQSNDQQYKKPCKNVEKGDYN